MQNLVTLGLLGASTHITFRTSEVGPEVLFQDLHRNEIRG